MNFIFHWPSLFPRYLVPYLFIFRGTSHGFFAGVLITANHKEAVILHCYTSHTGHTKVFQQWRKARKVYYFLGCYTDVTARCFRGKLKNSSRYHNSKNRRIRDRVDSRLQFVWKIRVMGSCTNRITCIIVPVSRRNHCS